VRELAAGVGPAASISVVLCSRDRRERLARALDRLPVESLRRHRAELVLVDNGSRDGTGELMRGHAASLACGAKVVEAPLPGLGRARNAGVAQAGGDLFVFTDDDCYLAPDYLDALALHFDAEKFSFGGGRILRFEASDADYGVRTSLRFEVFRPFTRLRSGRIQGSNMVVHRRVFERVGLFREDLGPGTPYRCDDVELLARAALAGFTGAFVPELVVHHHHGRKPGTELVRWMRSDDVARGAWYAAMIAGGDRGYLGEWARRSLSRRSRRSDGRFFERIAFELYGAARYSLGRARRRPGRAPRLAQGPRRQSSSTENELPSGSTTRSIPWMPVQMRRYVARWSTR
jgi:glycosyltransferase involved in cell wall biosynthesis